MIIAEIITFSIALIGAIAAAVATISKVAKSFLALERDMQHLRRSTEQHTAALNECLKDFDQRFDQLDLQIHRIDATLHRISDRLLLDSR